MFCPQCGASQSEELKFCKVCGANLLAVRQAVATRGETDEKFDWNKTWVTEMFLSEGERKRREHEHKRIKHELELQDGITPEVKRYNEIKAGVITSCAGLGVTIFLYFFMQGIILSGQNPSSDNEILSRVWIAGVIPFLIGLGLIFNGTFVSRKLVEASRRKIAEQSQPTAVGGQRSDGEQGFLNAADTAKFVSPNFSVTEDQTKHLPGSSLKP